jgi:hypothetical protein
MTRPAATRNSQAKLRPAAEFQPTEFQHFCGRRYESFGRFACLARETSRRPEPMTQT